MRKNTDHIAPKKPDLLAGRNVLCVLHALYGYPLTANPYIPLSKKFGIKLDYDANSVEKIFTEFDIVDILIDSRRRAQAKVQRVERCTIALTRVIKVLQPLIPDVHVRDLSEIKAMCDKAALAIPNKRRENTYFRDMDTAFRSLATWRTRVEGELFGTMRERGPFDVIDQAKGRWFEITPVALGANWTFTDFARWLDARRCGHNSSA